MRSAILPLDIRLLSPRSRSSKSSRAFVVWRVRCHSVSPWPIVIDFILIFEKLASSEYTVVVINRTLLTRAAALCRIHPLRAYDAVQLACALTQRDNDLSASRLAPIFVSADAILLSAAQAEGFVIENPNAYP
jgi:hypothetical protein